MSGELPTPSEFQLGLQPERSVNSVRPTTEPQTIWMDPDSAIAREVTQAAPTLNPDLGILDPAIAFLDAQDVMLDPETAENITPEQFEDFM